MVIFKDSVATLRVAGSWLKGPWRLDQRSSNGDRASRRSFSAPFVGTFVTQLSLRDVEELLVERGLAADHTTVWRWVQGYGPELELRIRRNLKATNKSWRVDETYLKVKGRWSYLYRAIDSVSPAALPTQTGPVPEQHPGARSPSHKTESERQARIP